MMLECSRIFVAIKIAPLQTDLYQLLGYIYRARGPVQGKGTTSVTPIPTIILLNNSKNNGAKATNQALSGYLVFNYRELFVYYFSYKFR